jgi:thioredoxin reductase (NADPH)
MEQMRFADGDVRVIGSRWSPRVHQIKDFLSRGRVPFRWYDTETDSEAHVIAEQVLPGNQRFPIVIFPDGTTLLEPGVRLIAEKLGLDTVPDERQWDVIILGGGPAGISASIYAASEGLRTIVVEQGIPGGQASYSASIENYPGFPEAMTGSELARRAVQQAERFGVEILVTRKATQLEAEGERQHVTLDNDTELIGHAVLLATGVSFRWLDAPGCPRLVGAGIYYGAAAAEASSCVQQDVFVLGGGNSAGQAALLLKQYARRVIILTTEDSLDVTMSKYLVDRIMKSPEFEVWPNTTVVGAEGSDHLEWITVKNIKTGETKRIRASRLFVFIGATPSTDWLDGVVMRDDQGFVLASQDFVGNGCRPPDWSYEREPFALETSRPGVFVAGDVRKGSVKRLTAAAGEGAMAAAFMYRHVHRLVHHQDPRASTATP